MGFLENARAIKDAIAQGLSGAGPTEEQLDALPPDQRAAYDAQVARAGAEIAAGQAELAQIRAAEMASRPLRGAAGEHVYGPEPSPVPPVTAAGGSVMGAIRASISAGSPRSRPVSVPAPPPPVSSDPAVQSAHERALRDEARTPYLAPETVPVVVERIPTRVGSQVDEVLAHLAASGLAGRPDLVFGAAPVPDRIGGTLTRDADRYVEWEVVHAATEPLPPAATPGTAWLHGDATLVARRSGEPSVLDEDVAIALLDRAGIGPERCAGIARLVRTVDRSGDQDNVDGYTMVHVVGVQVLGPAELPDAARRFVADGPLRLPPGDPAGVHVEVLNWRAIALAVHPDSQAPRPVPSPFPHLPSTPQELLTAYLQVVGVHPSDTYAASVTEDRPRDLRTRSSGWITKGTNRGAALPCADGRERPRIHGGAVVVIAYRDRPAYAEGRSRWGAYERDVLESDLAQRTGARRPVEEAPAGGIHRVLRGIDDVIATIDVFTDYDDDFSRVPPHRYCWPPSG